MHETLFALLGLLAGLVILLWRHGRWRARVVELETLLVKEREASAAGRALLADAERRLGDTFGALSAEALRRNNQTFLELAREHLGGLRERADGDLAARQQAVDALIAPIHQALDKLAGETRAMEQARMRNLGELEQQVRGLLGAQQALRDETGRLVAALRRPEARGRWGEVQLRRVVEMAGMLEHVDFDEQQSADDGQRPDMVARLPGGRNLVIDAKTPLVAYLEAVDAGADDARERALDRFARHLREHVQRLSAKAYWQQFAPTPEFVVLFLPGEAFLGAALRHDPDLIEYASARKVILATPTTLLALLKAVHHGWRQEALAENARRVGQLGAELHERLARLGEHWNAVGKHLGQTVKAYNEATGSLEARVLVTARKFEELRVAPAGQTLATPTTVDRVPRALAEVEPDRAPGPES